MTGCPTARRIQIDLLRKSMWPDSCSAVGTGLDAAAGYGRECSGLTSGAVRAARMSGFTDAACVPYTRSLVALLRAAACIAAASRPVGGRFGMLAVMWLASLTMTIFSAGVRTAALRAGAGTGRRPVGGCRRACDSAASCCAALAVRKTSRSGGRSNSGDRSASTNAERELGFGCGLMPRRRRIVSWLLIRARRFCSAERLQALAFPRRRSPRYRDVLGHGQAERPQRREAEADDLGDRDEVGVMAGAVGVDGFDGRHPSEAKVAGTDAEEHRGEESDDEGQQGAWRIQGTC
jgi:hypothetical protein